jgi:hypothetical protein
MNPLYTYLRRTARHIVTQFPVPEFYRVFFEEYEYSRRFLFEDTVLSELRDHVAGILENNFGHGLEHATKVAQDCGALVLIESRSADLSSEGHRRRLRLAHAASLLHDIRRKDKDHAVAGADSARPILALFHFSDADARAICYAIQSHEAFKPLAAAPVKEAELLADVLYDADKFRWGPDNFTDTLWEMVAYTNPSLADFISRYPAGMEALRRIRSTFRSETGRTYGPEFIDVGIAVGEKLLEIIVHDYSFLLLPHR